jgi:hypothetical protein
MIKKYLRRILDRRREAFIADLQKMHDQAMDSVARYVWHEQLEQEKARRSPEQLARMARDT